MWEMDQTGSQCSSVWLTTMVICRPTVQQQLKSLGFRHGCGRTKAASSALWPFDSWKGGCYIIRLFLKVWPNLHTEKKVLETSDLFVSRLRWLKQPLNLQASQWAQSWVVGHQAAIHDWTYRSKVTIPAVIYDLWFVNIRWVSLMSFFPPRTW